MRESPRPGIRRKLLRDETAQLGSSPTRLHKQRMDICEGLNASLDCALEPVGCFGVRKMHGRLHCCQHVPGSVLGLAREYGNLRLAALALRDVTREAAAVNELVAIPQNVGINEHVAD